MTLWLTLTKPCQKHSVVSVILLTLKWCCKVFSLQPDRGSLSETMFNLVQKNVQLSWWGPFNKRKCCNTEACAIFFLFHLKMPRFRSNAGDEIYDFIRLNCVLNNSAWVSLCVRVCRIVFFFPHSCPHCSCASEWLYTVIKNEKALKETAQFDWTKFKQLASLQHCSSFKEVDSLINPFVQCLHVSAKMKSRVSKAVNMHQRSTLYA